LGGEEEEEEGGEEGEEEEEEGLGAGGRKGGRAQAQKGASGAGLPAGDEMFDEAPPVRGAAKTTARTPVAPRTWSQSIKVGCFSSRHPLGTRLPFMISPTTEDVGRLSEDDKNFFEASFVTREGDGVVADYRQTCTTLIYLLGEQSVVHDTACKALFSGVIFHTNREWLLYAAARGAIAKVIKDNHKGPLDESHAVAAKICGLLGREEAAPENGTLVTKLER
jgi:hypothetical protein